MVQQKTPAKFCRLYCPLLVKLFEALLAVNDYREASGLTSFQGSNSASGTTFEKLIIRGGLFLPVD